MNAPRDVRWLWWTLVRRPGEARPTGDATTGTFGPVLGYIHRYVQKGAARQGFPLNFSAATYDGNVISSKRVLHAFAAALIVLSVVAACDSGALTQGPKLAKDQPLRVQLDDQPGTLDPGQTQYPYETAVLRAISEPLLKPSADLSSTVPAAALSYETTNNGTVYVFPLRTNGKYSDGTPVKAQDFVYGWKRLIDPRLASPQATFF